MSETISLKKRQQKKVAVRAAKIKHGLKTGRIKIVEKMIKRRMKGTGIVLLKHLPHGFFENELRKYFSQFGDVLKVVLCRSMRTGQSKGYAFIHFAEEDVAKIAAETMDNYLMFKKRMIAKFLTPSEAPSKIFRRRPITLRNVPLKKIRAKMNKKKNRTITEAEYEEKCKERLHKIKKVTNKLAEFGIDYNLEAQNVPTLGKKKQKTSKNVKDVADSEIVKKNVKGDKKSENKKSLKKVGPTKTANENEALTQEKKGNKKTKTSSKEEQLKTEENTNKTPKSESKLKTRSANKVKQVKINEKINKSPVIKKNDKKISLRISPRKIKAVNTIENIETKTKINKNENKSSILKAKSKIAKVKTQKKDVKKLKLALEQYMAENFGNSKPKLRSQTLQKKSKGVAKT